MYYSVYANSAGEIFEEPRLGLLGRSGNQWLPPEAEEMIPLPAGASLVSISRFVTIGINSDGKPQPISQDPSDPAREAVAVAALLPQGFTRTLLPACVSRQGEALPLYGYTAVGFKNGHFYAAAIQSDAHHKWHPRYYSTARLPKRIESMLEIFPENPVVWQIAKCSLEYGCFTAQNFFYRRWEAGIPTHQACNADCIGCISQSHIEALDSPQQRMIDSPEIQAIADMGSHHLQYAREPIISFGQGCEGEPSLNAARIAPAIEQIRRVTRKGTINCNTNAGYTKGIEQMADAGLDAMRVTLFSAREEFYNYYHRPQGYTLTDVARSIDYAKIKGMQVAINLLVFPGFTDLRPEAEALVEWVQAHRVDMIQLRNLNLDPDILGQGLQLTEEEALGIPGFIRYLQEALPAVRLGSYTYPRR